MLGVVFSRTIGVFGGDDTGWSVADQFLSLPESEFFSCTRRSDKFSLTTNC